MLDPRFRGDDTGVEGKREGIRQHRKSGSTAAQSGGSNSSQPPDARLNTPTPQVRPHKQKAPLTAVRRAFFF